jgi:hypothetical protein
MLPRFSSHVTAMTLAILGASVGPSWSVGAADQLIAACKSSDQACEAVLLRPPYWPCHRKQLPQQHAINSRHWPRPSAVLQL